MAMDDIGTLVSFEQKLQSCFAKERKPQMVVQATVITAPVEEIIAGMGFDKETLASVHPTAIDSTLDRTFIPGYPEVAVGFVQSPNMVVAHTVVLRQNHLYRVSPEL